MWNEAGKNEDWIFREKSVSELDVMILFLCICRQFLSELCRRSNINKLFTFLLA
jgi:hypothetical protein